MSNTSSTHVIKVTDGGTIKTVTKDAAALKNELNAAEKIAAKMRTPKPVAAARKAAQIDEGAQAGRDSGTARGIGGMTGAAGRDFAKQAEGLGGLVRVYATFAANIFAATAAFGALSRAADTSNLVKGLDQLGAAGGRNLGMLAKQMSAVTEGAISLRDAMTATAQASAGGMAGKDILRMTEVAKRASQALGVDMPNALSRLTRGIVKLEPELLDEIGIMVRLDVAVSNYAKTLGKSALSLTDFERRQAFANAVLEQGEKKFGAIQLDVNPYSRILASFQNLVQTGLELMNKVLGPIMGMLAESPTALGIALAGIVGTLLKQAVPAVSGWKKGLDSAAKSARDAAVEANKLRKAASSDEGFDLVQKVAISERNAAEALNKLHKGRRTLAQAANFDVANATNAELDNLRRVAEAQAKLDAVKTGLSDRTLAAHAKEQALVSQAITSIETRMKAEKRLQEIEDETEKNRNRSLTARIKDSLTLDAAQQRLADKAIAKSQRADIINAAVNDAAAKPYISTLKDMYAAIGNATKGQDALGKNFEAGHKKMSIFNAGLTAVKGTVLVTAGAITTLVASLGNVLAMVGIITTIFHILDGFMSNADKETAKYDESITNLESSLDNLTRTMDNIRAKDTKDIISIGSTQAVANALQDLTDNATAATNAFNSLRLASNGWDNAFDWLWGLIDKGNADKLAKNISLSVVNAFEALQDGPAKMAGATAISNILKIDSSELTNFKSLNDILEKLSDTDAYNVAKELTKALKSMSDEAGRSAANLTSLKNNLEETAKQSQQMIASLRATDADSKLGDTLLSSAKSMKQALEDPLEALQAIKELSGNIQVLALLPEEEATRLGSAREELERLSAALADSKQKAKEAAIEAKKLAELANTIDYSENGGRLPGATAASDQAKKAEIAALAQVKVYTDQLNEVVNRFKNIGNTMFEAGIKHLTKGLELALDKAAVSFGKGVNSIIGSIGGDTAAEEGRLKREEIAIQVKQIEALYNQSKNMLSLTLALEEANILARMVPLQESAKTAGGSSRDRIYAELAELQKGLRDVVLKKGILGVSDADAIKIAKDATHPLYEAAKGLQGYFNELFGKQGKLAELFNQTKLSQLDEQVKLVGEGFKREKVDRDIKRSDTTQGLSQLDLQSSLSGGSYDKQLEAERELLQIAAIRLDMEQKKAQYLELESKAKTTMLFLEENGRAKTTQYDNAKKVMDDARIQANRVDVEQTILLNNLKLQNLDKRLKGEAALATTAAAHSETMQQFAMDERNIILDSLSAQLSHREAMGQLDEQEKVNATYTLGVLKANLEFETKMLGITSAKIRLKLLEKEIDEKANAGVPVAALVQQYANQSAEIAAQVGLIEKGHKAKLVQLEADKESGLKIAANNKLLGEEKQLLEDISNLGISLTAVFGDMGGAIESIIPAINSMGAALISSAQEEGAIRRKMEDDLKKYKLTDEDENNPAETKRKLTEQTKIQSEADKKIANNKLDGYLKMTSAAKTMFKENSRGAEAVARIEKAIHIAKIAMWVKEQVAAVTTSGTTIAASLAAAGANSIKAITAAFAAPFPVGFVAGAAMVAIMSSLLGGGKKVAIPGGFSAEEQQKVQGTGQMYQDGQIVNRGGGALGDPTAKANSLNNAIEKIKEHSFATMEYSNEMLKNLEGIKKNTEGLSAMILQTGINSRGLNPDGSVKFGVSNVKVQSADIAHVYMEKFFNALGVGKDSGLGKIAGKISTAIFGGKVTTELLDVGIAFKGNMSEIIDILKEGGQGLEALYQNIKVTTSGGLFSGDKSNTTVDTEALERGQAEAFGVIFDNIAETVKSAAIGLGKDASIIDATIGSFDLIFKTSFKDLKPEELTEALSQEFSVQFNRLAEEVLPEFQKFRKPAEEFGDTIVRIARDLQVASFALEASGLNLGNILANLGSERVYTDLYNSTMVVEKYEEALVRISQSLIDKVGGIDALLSKTEFFKDNFLTEAERLAPIQKRVTDEMSRLGYAGITTREAFADLVRAQDLATEAGQNNFAALMNVAEGFAEVYEWADKANEELTKMSQKEFTSTAIPLTAKILELTPGTNRNGFEGYKTDAVAQIRSQQRIDSMEAENALRLAAVDTTGKIIDQEKINTAERVRSLRGLQEEIWRLEDLASLRTLGVNLMKAEGKVYEATMAERTIALGKMTNEEQLIQRQINAANDLSYTRKLEVDLSAAQGSAYEVLLYNRQQELRTLNDTDKLIKQQIYDTEDFNKTRSLETALAVAQGKTYATLAESRAKELKALSESDAAIQQQIYDTEDFNKTRALETALAVAQGRAYVGVTEARNKELAALSDTDAAIQQLIYNAEDLIKVRTLENDLLSVMGYTYVALVNTRNLELNSLTGIERALKQQIFEQEDLINTTRLQIELMEAEGNLLASVAAYRQLELRSMSATDQQLKIRIWRLQDEKELTTAYNNQQVTLLNLLGRESEALAISRGMELAGMDAQLRSTQQYIYALEDEKKLEEELQAAYSKSKTELTSTVQALRNASRALKDYRDSLLLSDKSILTPAQKYAEAKQQALDLAAIATGVATTETERLAKDAAISKLPGATDAWLEASRTLYASSTEYTKDFNSVLDILDMTSSALDAQQTDAEKQLSAIEESNSLLSGISETGRSIEAILRDLAEARTNTATAAANVPSNVPTVSSVGAIATVAPGGTLASNDTMWQGVKGGSASSKELYDYVVSSIDSDPLGVYHNVVSSGLTSAMMDSILKLPEGSSLQWAKDRGLPAFANGGYLHGKGILGDAGPELVDFQTPGRIYSNSNTMAMVGNTVELVNEIKALRAEVAKLREEQNAQTGHLIQTNYDANAKAAQRIAEANAEAANAVGWKERNKVKLA